MERLKQAKTSLYKKAYEMTLKVCGRVVLNVWRICKSGLKLKNYDLENVILELFKNREPVFNNWTLTKLYNDQQQKHIVLKYFIKRINYVDKIINEMGTLTQSSEQTRLFGCEFESTIMRGSQFRIESVLMRITKKCDFLLMSGSKIQVSHQKPLQSMPLVLEPPKLFYVDPVLILDFQSLYPSIMISHNICYSTCLGHIDDIFKPGGKKRFGFKIDVDIELKKLFHGKTKQEIMNDILIAPNNVVFVKKHIRKGIIPQILEEFLNTRIMIKESQKLHKNDAYIQQAYHFRQFGLKMFMNVTYGYTAASFSGRMPCSDIADSVVETGRHVLKSIIKNINQNKEWGANVVYGDTDSVFVHLLGRSREDAFKIGNDIVEKISNQFPYPMELKFEKVYDPCILVSKKRYVGHRYLSPKDKPKFESKGIEIVRRDGCDAQIKIMEKTLYELFMSKNLSKINSYLQKQYAKISNSHINLKDFILAKEVKLGKYSDIPPAHAIIGEKLEKKDPMKRPKYGERIKYLIQQGSDLDKIKDIACSVQDFLENKSSLNVVYYITRQINSALQRLFSSFDIDVRVWYGNMPKGMTKANLNRHNEQNIMSTKRKAMKIQNYSLNKYFKVNVCLICFNSSEIQICGNCLQNPATSLYLLQKKIQNIYKTKEDLEKICKNCASMENYEIEEVPCEEYNCDFLYLKHRQKEIVINVLPLLKKFVQVIQENSVDENF
ncbi:Ribonuclease H-like domain [Pseudocohnilembus persalinus]|uniref:DNA polymerase n=1 Tax=Pseudocohnilembus persalinus TaxID=266149 RepID=A0A0V0QFI9_PSEPJ|nr:Ribonuclease H-like domain [Pseudocohnilembus persalinus]|eukprot:KRX00969.1 Ribonuclease H-like domain [Pseudocohnilembus persalinus]